MAFIKIEYYPGKEMAINPANVMALKQTAEGATQVYNVDPNNPGLRKEDFLIHMPIDEMAALLNKSLRESGLNEAFLKIDHHTGDTLWLNSAHVTIMKPGHVKESTEIYLVDPTHRGLENNDLLIHQPLEELTKTFNDAIAANQAIGTGWRDKAL